MDVIKNAVETHKKQYVNNQVLIVFGAKECVYLI